MFKCLQQSEGYKVGLCHDDRRRRRRALSLSVPVPDPRDLVERHAEEEGLALGYCEITGEI